MKKIIPIRFDGYMESGGSTKPWRIVAISEDITTMEETPYVVKVFTANNIKQGHNIAKEFICNFLAGQFDLVVPEACLVDLHDEDFKASLNAEPLNTLSIKYDGLTFASRLLDASIINEQLKSVPYTIQDCATLFAFDCLVLNADRGGYRNKPNLLLDDEGFILIDHELALHILDNDGSNACNKVLVDLDAGRWSNMYEKHIFYSKLKSYRIKKGLFDTFEESLRNLNINHVQSLITDLSHNGIDVGADGILIDYLRKLKQNSHKFSKILLGIIS